MWHGIKPTRLWHLTGMRHMRNMLRSRLTASYDRVYNQRKRNDLIMLASIIFGSGMGVGYAFGLFTKKDCSIKKKEVVTGEEEGFTCKVDPCPAPKGYQKPKPCPKPVKD